MSYTSFSGEALDRWKSSRPSCYSQAMDNCVYDKPSTYRNCDLLTAAYSEDHEATEQAVDALPYCDYRSDVSTVFAIAGFAVGTIVGALLL